MVAQTLRHRQRRRGFRPELLHAGGDKLAEEIQLQAEPGRGNFCAHLQRVARHVGQMVAFVEHQQQVFRLRQHRFALQRRHHQRVVSHHHFGFLNFAPRDEERAFAVVVTVAVQTAGLVGAEPAPQIVADGFIGVIAQAVPFIAIKIAFQRCAELLLGFVVGREIVVEERQQILLRRLAAGKPCQVTRADVAPAAKGGRKPQVGDDFAQQGQIFAEDLVLQGHVGGADHQRFVLLPRDGDAGNEIRQGFPDAGRGFNRQMSPVVPGERFCHVGNHLPLRRSGDKIGDLLL